MPKLQKSWKLVLSATLLLLPFQGSSQFNMIVWQSIDDALVATNRIQWSHDNLAVANQGCLLNFDPATLLVNLYSSDPLIKNEAFGVDIFPATDFIPSYFSYGCCNRLLRDYGWESICIQDS